MPRQPPSSKPSLQPAAPPAPDLARFGASLGDPLACLPLFDALADTTFFIKDARGRYLAVNRTLAERVGASSPQAMLGKTAFDWFPRPLAESFDRLDHAVCRSGRPETERLRLHLYANHRPGWCLLHRLPLADRGGRVIGVAGLARDLQAAHEDGDDYRSLAGVIEFIRANLDRPLPLAALAARAGLSVWQLDQRIRRIFHIAAGQFVIRARIDRARELLTGSAGSIADIALDCGYADQSAFTRQFRQVTGLTPGNWRKTQADPSEASGAVLRR